ncbi:MAG: hypothetical protein HY287_12685 [Planctomycetes bacterium]|nr:hypothetical protein [Planctomycetota bacterium]MBI3835179.1 hypothetical protein [Planctomycetota bacterium]
MDCVGLAIFLLAFAAGCQSSRSQIFRTDASAVQLRSFQTRTFDTSDKITTLRTVMATLQDLGFVIDAADDVIGSVSATKLEKYRLRMTVTVRPHGTNQMLVRANAQFNLKAVEDPGPYQQFFEALGKAIFLAMHQVD